MEPVQEHYRYPFDIDTVLGRVFRRLAGEDAETAAMVDQALAQLVVRDSDLEEFLKFSTRAVKTNLVDALAPPPTANVVVAASNSATEDQDCADYICTGTGDEATLASAVADAAASGSNVELLAGAYVLSGTLDLTGTLVSLIGCGPEQTALSFGAGTYQTVSNANLGGGTVKVGILADTQQISGMSVGIGSGVGTDAACIGLTSTPAAAITNCELLGAGANHAGIVCTAAGDGALVAACRFEGLGYGVCGAGAAGDAGRSVRVLSCLFVDCDHAVALAQLVAHCTAVGVEGSTTPNAAHYCADVVTSCSSAQSGGASFLVGPRATLSLCTAQDAEQEGIVLDAAEDARVCDNRVVDCSQETTDTYAAIKVVAGSDNASVHQNTVRGTDHKYGIDIDAGTSDLWAVLNDLRGGYTTAAVLDNGTTTDTTTTGNLG